jgi:hypothetical protein
MPAPQSASVVHVASTQVPAVCVPASGAGATDAHFVPAWQGADVGVATGTSTQVRPLPQSAAVWQSLACAVGANASTAVRAQAEARIFSSDIGTPF